MGKILTTATIEPCKECGSLNVKYSVVSFDRITKKSLESWGLCKDCYDKTTNDGKIN